MGETTRTRDRVGGGAPLAVFLRLDGRRCLVVGGGEIAWAKVQKLLQAGARVHMVALHFREPDASIPPEWLAAVSRREGAFRDADLEEMHLVIAATSDPETQHAVRRAAAARGIWANVVDVPALCDFTFGASLQAGPLEVAVGTDGGFPLLSQRIRDRVASLFSPGAGDALTLLAEARRALHQRPPSSSAGSGTYEGRRAILRALLTEACLDDALAGNGPAVRQHIARWWDLLDESIEAQAISPTGASR